MKYILFYNEGCSPRTRKFDSLTEAEVWAGNFLLNNQENTADNWVDMIVKGRVERVYSGWAKEVRADDDQT